jgi:hypothetical protein
MTRLERRYRRMLAWYPVEYRDAYGEEMLAVLLEGAGPERHRPTVAEVADLLTGALRYRLHRARVALVGQAWQDTGAVAALAVPLLLLAWRLAALLALVPVPRRYYGDVPPIGPSTWVPTVGWALVVLAALTGLRRTAAALAWAALAMEAATIGLLYHRFGPLHLPLWTVVFAAVGALGLTLTPGARRGLRLLGPVGVAALATLTGLLALGPWLFGLVSIASLLGTMPFQWLLTPRVLAVPLALLVLLRLPRPLRRRLLLLIAPVLVYNVTEAALGGYVGHGGFSVDRWAYVEPVGPAVLALATFLLGIALVRRMERPAPRPTPPRSPQLH